MKRCIVSLILAATSGLHYSSADACGYWTLFDRHLDRQVSFGAMSVFMGSMRGRRAGRILELGGRTPNLYVTLYEGGGYRKEITVEGGTVFRQGTPIGKVDGDEVHIGGRRYEIQIGAGSKQQCATGHPVKIMTAGKVIAEAPRAVIPCETPKEALKEARDITRRLLFYLAWRERFLGEVERRLGVEKSKADPDRLRGLRRDLRGESWSKRLEAALILSALGDEAAPVLVEAFEKSRNTDVRLEALYGLRRMGTAVASYAPRLIRARREREEVYVREDLCETIAALGNRSAESIGALTSWIGDRASSVRSAAARGLGSMGASQEVISALAAVLQDRSPDVRRAAVTALGQLGPQAKDALPAIKRLLDDKDEEVIRAAGEAVRLIDT